MTREELEMRTLVRESDVIDRTDGSELAKAFNCLWEKYVEQEPCEDAISREDALMCLTGEIKESDTIETIIARFIKRIRKLPPVTPQQKTGNWIPVSKEYPKTEQYAFITVHNQTKICWYQNGVFVDGEQNAYTKENEEFVAWMPFQIPKPYELQAKSEG